MELKTLLHSKDFRNKQYRFALRLLGDSEAAHDALQDLHEKLWLKREQYVHHVNIAALSMKMMKDLCLDKLKHQQIKHSKLELLRQNDAVDSNNYEAKDLSTITKRLMNALPEKQKMVMHLRDVEGLTFDEMVEVMEMDVNAIRMNLSRARKTIREQLLKIMNYGL